MKKILFIAISAVLLSAGSMKAQDDNYFLQTNLINFSYQMGFPTGDLNEWMPENSFTGWDVEYKTMVTRNLAVGGHIGWQSFYKKYPRDTYEFPGGALTTTVFKYFYTIPMQAVVSYYFTPEGFVQPFVSFDVGVNYNERRGEIGIYVIEDNSWNFSFAPEFGVTVPFGKFSTWGLTARAKYNYNVYDRDNFKGLAYINAIVGLTYSF
jgi:hypothetical protein